MSDIQISQKQEAVLKVLNAALCVSRIQPEDFKYIKFIRRPSSIVIKDIDGRFGHVISGWSSRNLERYDLTVQDTANILTQMGALQVSGHRSVR